MTGFLYVQQFLPRRREGAERFKQKNKEQGMMNIDRTGLPVIL